jgi:hypothetical protein
VTMRNRTAEHDAGDAGCTGGRGGEQEARMDERTESEARTETRGETKDPNGGESRMGRLRYRPPQVVRLVVLTGTGVKFPARSETGHTFGPS